MALTNDAKFVMLDALSAVTTKVIALNASNETVSVASVTIQLPGPLQIGDTLDFEVPIEIEITAGSSVTQVRITNTAGTTIYGTKAIGATESFPYGGKLILTTLEIELPA